MADGRDHGPGTSPRRHLWTEIFRSFQVALDPRKLLVAAAGIVVMSFGWWVLSYVFYEKPPTPDAPEYQVGALNKEFENKKKPGGENYTEADILAEGQRRFREDFARWQVLDELAGPEGGRLRTPPWNEFRGENPFIFVTRVLGSPAALWWDQVKGYLSTVAPVLTEPLVKLLLPVAKVVSPGVSPVTRFYLLLIILWNLAVWAFFGGIITRLAAVQLAGKGPITLRQAVRYVAVRYVNYVCAPLIPLGIITAVIVGLIVVGLIGMIPLVGDIAVFGLGLPLIIVAGAIMAVFLVGLVGYPLMYTTLSVEGDSSDTFDALSRSINYVYQAPWQYIWYWLVALVYGAAVTFFVLFFASLMVYLGKWAVSQAPWNEAANRKPDYLFVYAPQSFGWRELLLKDSQYAITPTVKTITREVPGEPGQPPRQVASRVAVTYSPVNPDADRQGRNDFWWYNTVGAGLVGLWLGLLFLMMLGFTYSFFWSAATVIYLLMRKKVDEAELDEVAVEDEEPEAPLAPPKVADAPSTSLPVITPPAAPPPPPAPIPMVSGPLVPPPPPPTTIPFTGPITPEPGTADAPRPTDAPPKDDAPRKEPPPKDEDGPLA